MTSAFLLRHACPACGATGVERLVARPYAEPQLRAALTAFYAEVGGLDYPALLDAEYALARCTACGLIFQVEVPDDALLARLYEEWISPDQARARCHRDLPPWHFARLAGDVQVSAAQVGPAAPRLALDYGCGWGEWACMTRAFGFESWGTELSPTRRQHVAGLGIRVVSDAELPPGAFGLINLDQVLEHLPAPRETLALLAEKLHPGGVMRVAVPNGLRIGRALRSFDRELRRPRLGRLNPVAPLEHLNCFDPRSLLRLATACGLRRIRPPWRVLLTCLVLPPGAAARAKALVRPFYLRSRFATQVWLRRAGPAVPAVTP